MAIFRRPKRGPAPFALTDQKARTILDSVIPSTYQNGVSYRWTFVRETRTKSGTLGFIWRDPFDPTNERVWVVDFKTGATREIGPARAAPMKILPAPSKKVQLLPPSGIRHRRKLAQKLGEALLLGFRGRTQ